MQTRMIRPVVAGEDTQLGDVAKMGDLRVVVVDYALSLSDEDRDTCPSPCLWWAEAEAHHGERDARRE